jgi:periplasmic divalent cation tolerance protein
VSAVDARSGEEPDAVRAVLVTAPDAEVAEHLARTLVDERLAACVNLIPGIRSFYRWEGRVQVDDEVLLVIKTRGDRCEALTERVRSLHPYDLPEVLALPAAGGSVPYLEWVQRESRP